MTTSDHAAADAGPITISPSQRMLILKSAW